MKDLLSSFSKQRFDPEVYRALLWKRPDSIQVYIKRTDDGYFAKLVNFKEDNVITQAKTGEELVAMVNEAMYDFLEIPAIYRPQLGYFLPDEAMREEIRAHIPAKYLNRKLSLAKS